MTEPIVTVVIATYGWSSALRTSIPSVLEQTFADLELLVVGDGCDDDTADVVASFDDPRVRWHNLPTNTGSQTGPNNLGIELARGRYVAYLGHDDLWHPRHLEDLVGAIEREDADLAYAVGLLYGPRGSGIRGVSGLAEHDGLDEPAFTPPSSILHRRDLVDTIGPWRGHRTLTVPQDYDFQRRAWNHRRRFAATRRPTVFKFTAGWRADAYLERDVSDQSECLGRMRSDPDFVELELVDVVRAFLAGTVVPIGVPPESTAPGTSVEELRAHKGVTGFSEDELVHELAYRMDGPHRGVLEWYDVEEDPEHGPFRWTGPATSSSVRLPLAADRDLQLRFRVVNTLAPELLPTLRVTVNGTDIDLQFEADEDPARGWYLATVPSTVLARGARGALLVFHVGRTVTPRETDPQNPDERQLGVAISEVHVGEATMPVVGRYAEPATAR